MALRDPRLDQMLEEMCLCDEFRGLGFGRYMRRIIVEPIALPTAGLEVGDIGRCRRVEDESCRLEGCLVVTRAGCDPVASAGKSDLAELENSIVGRTEPPVGRKSRNARVLQVPRHDLAKRVNFLFACCVPADAACVE